VEQIC
jgi:hypothetical protein